MSIDRWPTVQARSGRMTRRYDENPVRFDNERWHSNSCLFAASNRTLTYISDCTNWLRRHKHDSTVAFVRSWTIWLSWTIRAQAESCVKIYIYNQALRSDRHDLTSKRYGQPLAMRYHAVWQGASPRRVGPALFEVGRIL